MTKQIIAPILFLLLLITTGCESETLVKPNAEEELVPFAIKTMNAASATEAPVLAIPLLDEVGSSKLVRNRNGVTFNLKTTGLLKGNVYTIWMVVFNNPEFCENGCDFADLFNPAVQGDLLYAAGSLVGNSGTANFAGRRNLNDDNGSIVTVLFGLPSFGILDTKQAEIHFVVHSHGPKIPGLVHEMLKSFNAGCGPVFDGIAIPEELGTYGPNTCADVQFAQHLP